MNSFLTFKDPQLEKQYYQNFTFYLELAKKVGFTWFILRCVIMQIFQMIVSWSLFKTIVVANMQTAGYFVAGFIVIYLVKRQKKRIMKFLCSYPKYITWTLDIFIVGVISHSISSSIKSDPKYDYKNEPQIFFNGWVWCVYTSIFTHGAFNWLPRALIEIILFVIVALSAGDLDKPNGGYRILNTLTNTILLLLIRYYQEKSNRETFKRNSDLVQQSEVWKKIINAFPEGFLLVSKEGKPIFYNKSLEDLISGEYAKVNNESNIKTNIELKNLMKFRKLTIAHADDIIKKLVKRSASPTLEIRVQSNDVLKYDRVSSYFFVFARISMGQVRIMYMGKRRKYNRKKLMTKT